jgi:hypothetical protein
VTTDLAWGVGILVVAQVASGGLPAGSPDPGSPHSEG